MKNYKLKLLILFIFVIVVTLIYINVNNSYAQQALFLLYLGAFIYGWYILWRFVIKGWLDKFKINLIEILNYIIRKSRYVIAKVKKVIKDYAERGRMKGRDERSIVLDFDFIKRIKRALNYKTKLVIGNDLENVTKIRLLYIKLILQSIKRGLDYKDTLTPNEIYNLLNADEIEYIIKSYEFARYNNCDVPVLNRTVEDCEKILSDFFNS